MSITVKAAREALEAAIKRYQRCEHGDVSEAKHAMDIARREYGSACVNLIERLPQRIIGNSYCNTPMNDIYKEITGETL